jgi:predicted amidohydrolase
VSASKSEAIAEDLSVAILQLTSIDDYEANLEQILLLLNDLEQPFPDLVCLPENALYLRIKEGEPIPGVQLEARGIRRLSEWCRKSGSFLHLGSVPLERDGALYNSSIVLSPNGEIIDSYQKIHLFDVDVEGQKSIRESDVFKHGDAPSVFQVKGWKIANSICYDLRFSELFLRYARLEVDAILIPAAFLVQTGRAHWETLTRARAIESQAYVLAAAQGGRHIGRSGGERETYGHSIAIDPWGLVLGVLTGESSGGRILRVTLSQERIRQVRAQIPMRKHRRL